MHAVLILNPVAGKSLLAETREDSKSIEEEIRSALRMYDIEPEVWYTTPEDPGERLARKATDDHVDLVIAAGGDGTIHSVASGLLCSKSTLGIIPMGTMNNLAHSLGIPSSVEAACEVLARGETRSIDASKINEQTFSSFIFTISGCNISTTSSGEPHCDEVVSILTIVESTM